MKEDINVITFTKPKCDEVPRGFGRTNLDELPLAMAWVPMQNKGDIYDEGEGLDAGTIFKNLDKPFYGGAVK